MVSCLLVEGEQGRSGETGGERRGGEGGRRGGEGGREGGGGDVDGEGEGER